MSNVFGIPAQLCINQCCGSALVSMRIRIQGFDDQKFKKEFTGKIKLYFLKKMPP
jgi:hypothetical protein